MTAQPQPPATSPRTIAITGATGFVGGHVVAQALAAGHRVLALKRHMRMSDYLGSAPQPIWVEGTLEDDAALARLCEGADTVLHIAGAVNVPTRAAFAAANIAGTAAIIAAAKGAGVRRFIHVSTIAARHPHLSNYGWSKAEAEALVQASGLDWTMVRPPAVYGPKDSDLFELFRMAKKGFVLLPPRGRTSIIHVDDLARLLLALAASPDAGLGAIYEPDDGAPGGLSHVELGRAIGRAVGRNRTLPISAPRLLLGLAARGDRLVRGDKARFTPDRASYMAYPDWVADPALAPPASLWQPRWPADEGLAMTAQWYRQNRWL